MRSLFAVGAPTPSSVEAALRGPADGLLIEPEPPVAGIRPDGGDERCPQALPALASTAKTVLAGINDVMTETGQASLVRLVAAGAVSILLGKVHTGEELHRAHVIISRAEAGAARPAGVTRLWAMLETAECVLHLKEIGTAPRIAGLVFGAGHPACGDPDALLHHKQRIVLAARVNGLQAIDSGYPAAGGLDSAGGAYRSALMSAELDFDGTMAYAPGQVQAIHRAFTPTRAEYDAALRGLGALADAYQRGEAKAVVDGRDFGGPRAGAARGIVSRFEKYGRDDQAGTGRRTAKQARTCHADWPDLSP